MIDLESKSGVLTVQERYEDLKAFILASLTAIHKYRVSPLVQRLVTQGGANLDDARAIRSAMSEMDLVVQQFDNDGYRPSAVC